MARRSAMRGLLTATVSTAAAVALARVVSPWASWSSASCTP
ncbi:hypothetical protein ACFW6N_32115 [Streptomyces cyaneofuscatus]